MSNTQLTTLTSKLAAKFDLGDGSGLLDTLKKTAFKGAVSDEQMTAANLKDLPVKPHPHFDLMMKYVEIAQTTDKPWEAFQVKGFVDEWVDVSAAILFNENLQYRLKPEPPKTIRIGEYDVPEPVREPLEDDKEYWGVDPMAEELAWKYKWNNALFCNLMFRRGLIHLTKEAAVIHAKALLSLTKAAD